MTKNIFNVSYNNGKINVYMSGPLDAAGAGREYITRQTDCAIYRAPVGDKIAIAYLDIICAEG